MDSSKPECSELKKWVEVDLPLFAKNARFNLSLAQSNHEIKTWFGGLKKDINGDLDTLGSYKFVDWEPLSVIEKKFSEAQMNDYVSQIQSEAKRKSKSGEICKTCEEQFIADALLAVKLQHYQTYTQMMSELPIMQYLKDPKFTKKDLKAIFKEMNEGLDKEVKHLDELERYASQVPIPPDALNILNYSAEVEEELLENDKLCGLATSLMFTMSNREIGNGIAIGLPILAASFFAGPVVLALGGSAMMATVVGTGTSIIASGAFVGRSYADFKKAQNLSLSHIYGDDLGADQAKLDSASRKLKYDVVTLPVGFGLLGLASKSLTIGKKSLETGRSIFNAESKAPM